MTMGNLRESESDLRMKSEPKKDERCAPAFSWSEDRGDYRIRFAEGAKELARVQALRFAVFAQEMGANVRGAAEALDVDEMDVLVDHLMVVHRPSGECVGTYRLATAEQLSGRTAGRGAAFYTRRIFDMDALSPAVEEQGVELGRACIALNHRSRGVFQLLLRGIGRYLVETGKRYLFGCGSVPLKDLGEVERAVLELRREGLFDEALNVVPTPAYQVPAIAPGGSSAVPEIPSLLSAYGSLGARFGPRPAYDPDFRTLDFFVLLDLEQVHPRIYARFCGDR